MAVINALDEQTYQTRAYTVPNGGNFGNQDYLEQSKISHSGDVFGFNSHHDSGNLWSVLLPIEHRGCLTNSALLLSHVTQSDSLE